MSETPSRCGEGSARESERADRAATVLVNGAEFGWSQPGTVADLLARLGMQGKRVAVSIDRSVIPRSRHGDAPVRAGDRIEILEAVGGG